VFTTVCVFVQLDNITAYIDELVTVIECPGINSVYSQAVNHSICDSFYSGIFVMCIVHFVTAGCLYFVLLIVSRFHAIYEESNNCEQAGDDGDNEDEEGAYQMESGVQMAEMVANSETPTTITSPEKASAMSGSSPVDKSAVVGGGGTYAATGTGGKSHAKGLYWDVPNYK
jgi:hypothetical protein